MTVCLSGCRQLPSRGRHLFGQKKERTPKRPFSTSRYLRRRIPNGALGSNRSILRERFAHRAEGLSRCASSSPSCRGRRSGRRASRSSRPAPPVLVAADDGATVYCLCASGRAAIHRGKLPGLYRAASTRPRSSSGRARWLRTTRALEATPWSWPATVTRTHPGQHGQPDSRR